MFSPTSDTSTSANIRSIAFVDSGISHTDSLIAGLSEHHVIQLPTETNGIEEITQALSKYQNLESIHIFSHGENGSLQLGNASLSQAFLSEYQDDLASWGEALIGKGDLFLYGCQVAANSDGMAFVQQVSELTQADVAASDDATGHTSLGGDWALEVTTGAVGTSLAVEEYEGILPTYNGNTYELTNSAKSWEEAQAEAQSRGGNLVTVNDASEETWLRQTFGAESLWIGLTDKAQEGNFQWISGESSSYRNWAPGEPNDYKFNGAFPAGEDYVQMNWGSANQWNDMPNDFAGDLFGIIEISDTTPPPTNGNGLKAEYFNDQNFTDLALTRTDATVDFNWGGGSPNGNIGSDNFSARWTGQIEPRYSETYTFQTTSDDGVRLWVNDQLIIDKFVNQAPTAHSGTISLQAGQKYDIRMDYYEAGGGAVAQLAWSSNQQAFEIVPQSQLFSSGETPPITPVPPTPQPNPTDISFKQIGSFKGIQSGPDVLSNPTSLQFGPDGRLYVSEQNGMINAFQVGLENGEYVATSLEEINLVQTIQNHNDDGSLSGTGNRQVTGILVAGTATNPVLYASSSDPRISANGEVNLDTNSGVITRLTWNGSTWNAVDIVRGLPRSEENHSNNGLVLSPDGTKLYVAVGGNTNNGAPSKFFSYTGEYALSGTVLEIDLVDLNSRTILTDNAPGQNGRQYIYDLPTLDDPSVPNITDGVGEDAFGLDEAGPWGGNDGFNMAILPADAPLRIYADGFRNHYDLVITENGKLYTVDNGSNGNLGGNPIANGSGQATNTINDGGTGDPEPLFLIEEGGYYGHPSPARANQKLAWTVYDNDGNPDASISPNSIPSLADLVPDSVNIQDGFIIDPSKFTGDPARLSESGIRVERDSAQSNALLTVGSSSNGLVEYTGNAFGGALKGDLLVAQFNGNIGRLDLNADGKAAVYETIPGMTGLSTPLDVITGPDGTVWVAQLGGDFITVFAPTDVASDDSDADNDGILDLNDPFIRDASNGGSAVVNPGQTLLWDFDANQDDNLVGPAGYGGGLTGVMINGTTDFEKFFQSPSSLPGQDIKLDNVKFTTAAGGGTTVIETVSSGDPYTSSNSGEYLFHTGVTIAPEVDTFNIKWSVFNPGSTLTETFQQLGGYIGTGDQGNYLKLVAIQSQSGEIQFLLEDGDAEKAVSNIQADDLFDVPDNSKIFFEVTVDTNSATATPTITYETATGNKVVTGAAINLAGTAVWEAIQGNYTVNGQTSGLAVGLFSSNRGTPPADFQAIFDDIEITASSNGTTPTTNLLYRVNAGGEEIAALDGGPNWAADTAASPSPFLVNPDSNKSASFPSLDPGSTVPGYVPGGIFDSERYSSQQWAFATPTSGLYEVRLFMGNGYGGTSDPGKRIFDVAIEGNVLGNLDDIDLSSQFGHQVGGFFSNTVEVTDGILNLDFLAGVENPLINGIEILKIED